jgi:WD40 repeat protein
VWDVTNNFKEIATLKGHSGSVNSVIFSPNGKYIVSGSSDTMVKVWDVKNGFKELITLRGESLDEVISSAKLYVEKFNSDAWDNLEDKEMIETMDGDMARECIDDAIRDWGMNSVNSVAFSLDGKYIVSGSGSNTIEVWNVDNNFSKNTISEEFRDIIEIYSVTFSPSSKYIVSGADIYDDSPLKVWDIKNNFKEVAIFKGHSGSISSVAFSPNGKYIVTGSTDKLLGWDNIESRQEKNSRLDRMVIYLTIEKESFELDDVLSLLAEEKVEVDASAVKRSLERLVIMYVLKKEHGAFSYRIPLMKEHILQTNKKGRRALLNEEISKF